MSFVFRTFNKSRRKKDSKVNPSTSPSSGVVHGISGIGLSTFRQDSSTVQQKKKSREQQLLASQHTDDDDDDRTHPLNELSPSHCSSSVPMNGTPSHEKGPLHQPRKNSNIAAHSWSVTNPSTPQPLMDSSRRNNFFSVMRRKSSSTPDTSASTPSTSCEIFHSNPESSTDSKAAVITVKRGKANQFSEIYAPTTSTCQVSKKLNFQEWEEEKKPKINTTESPTHNSTRGSGEQIPPPPESSMPSPGEQFLPLESQSQEPVWGVPVPHESRRGTRGQPISDQPGNSNIQKNISKSSSSSHGIVFTGKTLIMNGDIVLSASHSNATSDTATTASTTSSKNRALRREAERISRAAASLDTKGNELFEKGYFDKAMACYSKALKLKRRTFAHLLEEVDDMEEQLTLCESQRADPQVLVSMATSINNIGYLRQRSGDATPDETMAAYSKSLHIKRRVLGNDSLSVGKTLNNIGSVHYLKREFDQAIPAYEEALRIMKVNLGDKHTDVATVMSNIGDVFLAQGDPETSLRQYRQALSIRWENFGEKDPRVVRLLEKIAKVEIGDRMMTPKKATNEEQQTWDDDEGSENLDSGLKPIAEEFQVLHREVSKDIEHVTMMERRATVEMLKDKIVIIRGMRDIWEDNGPELLDNDTASVKTARSRASGRGSHE
jgi:tetratricopeptide (TPR) repeat protein